MSEYRRSFQREITKKIGMYVFIYIYINYSVKDRNKYRDKRMEMKEYNYTYAEKLKETKELIHIWFQNNLLYVSTEKYILYVYIFYNIKKNICNK